jgi:hypothetical protein
MMIHNRSQRRVADSISDRTLSKKEFDDIISMSAVENDIFVFISNNVMILRCFYMAQQTIAHRFNVTRKRVNELIGEWSKRGYFNKTNRFNNSCIYKATPLLKFIVMALLPLIPDLYILNRKDLYPYIKLQTEKLHTMVNKELLSEGNNNYLSLSTYDTKRTRAILATIRAEEIRNASMSLHCVGTRGCEVTWVRGNSPQWDNSIVEKERAMSDESYDELQHLFPDWREQTSNGPANNGPVNGTNPNGTNPNGTNPSYRSGLPNTGGQQNPASNVNNPIKGNAIRATTQNTNVNVPPRHEVGADGMITVNGKKFLPQRIGNEWKPTPDFVVNRDVSGVERPAFEKMWEDPEVQAKAKKVGIVGYAGRSFFEEFIVPQMKERD